MPNRLPRMPLLAFGSLLMAAAPAFAQKSPLAADTPSPLPSPPALVHYTVESPMLLVVTLLCAGLVAFLVLNSKGKGKQAAMAAGACIALAAVVWVLAQIVTTDREKVRVLTENLVTSAAKADITALDASLTSDAKLYSPATPPPDGMPKDQILNRVRAMLGKNGAAQVSDYAVLEAQVQIVSPTLAYVQTYVRVTGAGAPVLSWWRLDAEPDAQGQWRVSGIQYLSSNFQIPDL